jgi:hypothetical protein
MAHGLADLEIPQAAHVDRAPRRKTMRSITAGFALAIFALLTCTAHAQVGYLVASPGGMYVQTYATPASVPGYAMVSYGYAQPYYSMAPVTYATVSYPQLSYAAHSGWYATSVTPQVAGQLTVMPVGYASGVVYTRSW